MVFTFDVVTGNETESSNFHDLNNRTTKIEMSG